LHFVLFEVMLLPDYINLSQNWSKGISAERNYLWGQKETCFHLFSLFCLSFSLRTIDWAFSGPESPAVSIKSGHPPAGFQWAA